MKKVLLGVCLLMSLGAVAQYTPMDSKYKFKSVIQVDSATRILGFADTTAANSYRVFGTLIKSQPGWQIRTANDFWMRNTSATAWLQFVNVGAGSTSAFGVWNTKGNAGLTDANFLGTTDNIPLQFFTNGVKRLELPESGIARTSGGANKYMLYDTTNKVWGYGDGGGTTPTLQQVTTAGATTDLIIPDAIWLNGAGSYGKITRAAGGTDDDFILPYKAGAGGTFAMTSDIVTPNIHAVLLAGHSAEDNTLEFTSSTVANKNLTFQYDRLNMQNRFSDGTSLIFAKAGSGSVVNALPNQSGVFAVSVNGTLADSTGNIVVSTGSGTVTSFGKTDGYSFLSSVTNPTSTVVFAGAVDTSCASCVVSKARLNHTRDSLVTLINLKDTFLFNSAHFTIDTLGDHKFQINAASTFRARNILSSSSSFDGTTTVIPVAGTAYLATTTLTTDMTLDLSSMVTPVENDVFVIYVPSDFFDGNVIHITGTAVDSGNNSIADFGTAGKVQFEYVQSVWRMTILPPGL